MVYLGMMLCRFFGRKDPFHLNADWTPFLEEVLEGRSFNWHKILSDNIVS
jgi:hypothetical protein